ncbi:amino acid transporter [Aspergillus ambiguus]|uniref:amino acid transporter n=1 Tax=Aspergillus ambiguus TaxID=176160 RepID=UPI003CCD33DA
MTTVEKKQSSNSLDQVETQKVGTIQDETLHSLGYSPQLRRTRNLSTILFMSLSIASIPYGIGSSLMSAIYGGGQLSLFVGLLVVLILDACVAVSLAEMASRYPTSSGVYYYSYQLSKSSGNRKFLSFLTGWIWLIGNWTITLSVNFGFASLLAATTAIFWPEWEATSWQLLLMFYATCLLVFAICAGSDRFLPLIDTLAAACTLITCIVVAITLSVTAKAGRHSAGDGLSDYDTSLSGWGSFTFFIGLLPPAYTFSALGMVTSMAEECTDPEIQMAKGISLVPIVGGAAAILFVLPICFTLPALPDITNAPYGQALPCIFQAVTGSRAGALALMILVLLVSLFCAISISTTASRCTWAFSRDNAIPFSHLWSTTINDSPIPALCLVTTIEMLLGLIYLGSSSAFTAFASVGVIALAVAYCVPITISLLHCRVEVLRARWNAGPVVGAIANVGAICWIAFQLVLFSLPTTLPVTRMSMNYAAVVFVGCVALSMGWYAVFGKTSKLCGCSNGGLC